STFAHDFSTDNLSAHDLPKDDLTAVSHIQQISSKPVQAEANSVLINTENFEEESQTFEEPEQLIAMDHEALESSAAPATDTQESV
ncbi:DNA polymerase III subunit gamma/tau, partial [Acinetobacter nosocomialis]